MTRTQTSKPTAPKPSAKTRPVRRDLSKWMGTDLFEAWLDAGRAFQDFVAGRIREDVKTRHRLLHCATPAELHRVQAEFLQKAIDDYAAETGRMMDMGKRVFSPRD